jgi:alkylated DNA repair dioxygenase AlkB
VRYRVGGQHTVKANPEGVVWMRALVLSPCLDLRSALLTVIQAGAAFVPDAVPEEGLSSIRHDLASAAFSKLPEYEGVARQEGEICVLDAGSGGYPAIRRLRDELAAAVHTAGVGITGLDSWHPDDISVQRYRAGAAGITPHRDRKRYRSLVAIATIEGTAAFTLCKNRNGDPALTWQASQGSLVLLRGPGLAGTADDRPLHTVKGPAAGQRTSIGFRMNTTAAA